MSYFSHLISSRLNTLNFANPLVYLDFLIAFSLIVGTLVYLKRFPTFRVILGTAFLLACSIVFFIFGFTLTALVFGLTGGLILITLPLIFSSEIRHYLEKLGRFSFLRVPNLSPGQKNKVFIRNLTEASFELAERKIGAILVLARKTGLGQTIETGVIIDARFGSKLLQTIFSTKSPLHDGAVIIKDGRILAAGCLLPISGEIKLDPPYGTRHKSGLAVTRDTDAVSVIISEQRGEVSLAENGKLAVNLDRVEFSRRLAKLLGG